MLLENDGNQLDDESLGTFMCEAEAIINKKPLTGRWPADPDSLATLKPNYLLTMKSKIVLPPPGTFRMLTCTQKTLETLSTPSK